MDPGSAAWLSSTVLGAHLLVIAFNVFGLFAIPLGAWRGWAFVRIRWWRALHVASFAIVALQAALGRACFLTLWQNRLSGETVGQPLIMTTVNRLIYWPLPMWVFTAAYLALFAYVVLLWRMVPPRARTAPRPG
jgi:hypothetical protein